MNMMSRTKQSGNPWHQVMGCVAGLLAVFASAVRAEDKSPRDLVAEGNKAVQFGQYDEAIDRYKQAETLLPESPEVAYDLGVAYYRQKDYKKAVEYFSKALATRNPSLEAKTKYNLGNCSYSSALQKQEDTQAAVKDLQQAIQYYRDAIDLVPDEKDARANIERAQLLIKDLKDKEKQKQEQQKKDQDKKDEKKDPSSQPSSQPSPQSQPTSQDSKKQDEQKKDEQKQDGKDQQKQGEEQEKEGEKKEGQKDDKEQKGKLEQADGKDKADKDKKEEQQAQEAQAAETQPSLPKEEAERLLQAIRDKERQRREEQLKRLRIQQVPVDKDW